MLSLSSNVTSRHPQSLSSTFHGHIPAFGASSGSHPRVSNGSAQTPLNPSPGLGLPSQTQFIIGSSFRQEKFSTSALAPRVFRRVRTSAPESSASIHLLSEYGGNLPRLPEVPNLLDTTQHVIQTPSLSPSPPYPKDEDSSASLTHLPKECSVDHARRRKITSSAHVSPRSQLNPFYGYPIDPSSYALAPLPLPYLRHGRRRKRDLIRTLAVLWWEKWGSRVSWTFSLLFVFFCARWWWRQRRKSMFFIRSRPNEV